MYIKASQGIWAEGSIEARKYQKCTLFSSLEPDFTNAAFWKWLGPPAVRQACQVLTVLLIGGGSECAIHWRNC